MKRIENCSVKVPANFPLHEKLSKDVFVAKV
jgi:hypothetical protein